MNPVHAGETGPIIQRPYGATSRFVNTIVHLRPVQIANRISRKLTRLHIPDGAVGAFQRPAGALVPFMHRPRSMLSPTSFRFLTATHEVALPIDWDNPARPLLWTYNLHYFDDLSAADAANRKSWHENLLDRWLRENAPPAGTAWAPFPASLRTVNLVKWILRSNDTAPVALRALGLSARAVYRQLEYHLLGNHLLANAKALFLAGLCVDSTEASTWLRRGREILDRQVPEQILADGAHFELSPMYHSLVVEDALDLVNFARAFGAAVPAGLDGVLPRMLSWLVSMLHLDGDISFFNDAAIGIAANSADLLRYGRSLGIEPEPSVANLRANQPTVRDMPASGYARLVSSTREGVSVVALCDAAEVGPGYLPGHAHADTLSFELSIGAQRVIVNAGTSVYAGSTRRIVERSTSSHSTVELAHADSSDVWDAFRCGARASIVDRRVQTAPDVVSVSASHDGYAFIPGQWMHQRTWVMSRGNLQVQDVVCARHAARSTRIPIVVRFLLHPGVTTRPGNGQCDWVLEVRGVPVARFSGAPALRWTVEPGSYSREFGVTVPTSVLIGRVESAVAVHADCRIDFDVR